MTAEATVQSLQSAVRRRLWQGQFVAAARRALWGSAVLMLLAAVVHMAARRVHVDAVLSALVALWAMTLAWAGLRRPSDLVCALWADRHLGGASAFSTLLEMREGKAVSNDQAMRWLERWTEAKVPHSLLLLGGRHESARLSKPLLAMLVCTALATIVLTLPGTVPSAPQEPASPSATAADRLLPDAERPASADLVGALASALRSADSRRASDRRDDSLAPAATPGRSDAGTESRVAQTGTAPQGELAASGAPASGAASEAAPTAGAKPTTSAGSGRDAGDSRDERADTGVSRVPQSTMQAQRRESSGRRPSPERHADPDQLATFDEEPPMHRMTTAREVPNPAAATPPPATDAAPLTPTKAAYVYAWMKASRQRR
jgi:hypothetical protein